MNQNIECKNDVRDVSITETELYAVSTQTLSFCLFKEERRQTIHPTHWFTLEGFRLPVFYSQEQNFLTGFSPGSHAICIASLKTLVFLKETVYGDSHSGPQSARLLKLPLSCLLRLHRGRALPNATWWQRLRPVRLVAPIVVPCLSHLTATGTTAALKCCWSKSCLVFGIELHSKRQEKRATGMEGGMSRHRALHSKPDPAADH